MTFEVLQKSFKQAPMGIWIIVNPVLLMSVPQANLMTGPMYFCVFFMYLPLLVIFHVLGPLNSYLV